MRKKNFLFICVLLSSMFCLGCATAMVANLTKHKEPFISSGNPDLGTIYFYRESEYVGSLRTVFINVDGRRRGALN